MTIILKQIFNFLKLLNSDKGTNQIAAGIGCGLILGLVPAFSLQTVLVIFLIFFLRIQIGATFLAAFFFAIPAYLLDSFFHNVGSYFLGISTLKGIYVNLYNMPIIPFTRFYNSIVMGSGVVAIILFPFVFFLARLLIQKYREKIVAKFQKTKFWKFVKATSLYKWYAKYEQLYG